MSMTINGAVTVTPTMYFWRFSKLFPRENFKKSPIIIPQPTASLYQTFSLTPSCFLPTQLILSVCRSFCPCLFISQASLHAFGVYKYSKLLLITIFYICFLMSIYYLKWNFPVGPSVGQLVGRSVCLS